MTFVLNGYNSNREQITLCKAMRRLKEHAKVLYVKANPKNNEESRTFRISEHLLTNTKKLTQRMR